MKKKLLLITLGFCSMMGYSQIDGKNELKVNLPYYLFGMPEVTYERIIDENSAVGISGMYTLESPDNILLRWMVTPYYRMYFGGQKTKTKATGFYVEGSAAIANQIVYYDDYSNEPYTYYDYEKRSTNFGYGVAIGVKLLNKNGYMADLFGGISRVFGVDDENATDYSEFYPRVGISIGKRF